jgi:hypothetical protein
LTFDDLGRSPEEEVIILKRIKEGLWDDGDYEEYVDTPETKLYRTQMLAINAWLADADITFDEAVRAGKNPTVVDPQERRLRRVFTNGRFDNGGRLFGGFWQALSKRERLEGVWIGDERVVELDYGQMNPRIVYGLCGVNPPPGDLYLVPGFEANREGIKKTINAMLFHSKRLSRMPQGVRLKFAEEHRIEQVMKAIEEAHVGIREHFFTGIGHHAQFIESQILVDLLLVLQHQGIVALPIHDAVLVSVSKKDYAMKEMLALFLKHARVEGLVRLEDEMQRAA